MWPQPLKTTRSRVPAGKSLFMDPNQQLITYSCCAALLTTPILVMSQQLTGDAKHLRRQAAEEVGVTQTRRSQRLHQTRVTSNQTSIEMLLSERIDADKPIQPLSLRREPSPESLPADGLIKTCQSIADEVFICLCLGLDGDQSAGSLLEARRLT